MSKMWVVRTPFRDDISSTFGGAINFFMQRAAEMGIQAEFKLGKGKQRDGIRYHYWRIYNQEDAFAFHLAWGDEIKEYNAGAA